MRRLIFSINTFLLLPSPAMGSVWPHAAPVQFSEDFRVVFDAQALDSRGILFIGDLKTRIQKSFVVRNRRLYYAPGYEPPELLADVRFLRHGQTDAQKD